MERCVRTPWGAELQTQKFVGLPFKLRPNTTLNERFDILTDAGIAPNEMPDLECYCIGIGGHGMTNTTFNIAFPSDVLFKSTNASLYKPMPFVLRQLTNDLTLEQRAQYCLRKIVQFNGEDWYAYYGKRIVKDDLETKLIKIIKQDDGTEIVESYVPGPECLSPTPPDLLNTNVNILNAELIRVTCSITIPFTEFDAEEYRNVASIMYNTTRLSIISEVALCTGINRVISTTTNGNNTVNFKELIATQINLNANYFASAYEQSLGFNIELDIGTTEPMFGYQPQIP